MYHQTIQFVFHGLFKCLCLGLGARIADHHVAQVSRDRGRSDEGGFSVVHTEGQDVRFCVSASVPEVQSFDVLIIGDEESQTEGFPRPLPTKSFQNHSSYAFPIYLSLKRGIGLYA